MRRPVLHQRVATVLRRPQCAARWIDGNGDRVANAGGPALAIALALSRAPEIEAPNAGAGRVRGTGVLSWRLKLAILRLTCIRRRSDVHEEIVAAQRDRLRGVTASGGQLADDGIGRPGGRESEA